MDTRRCLRCHKLSRADARSCSQCGYVFSQAPITGNGNATGAPHRKATASLPSNPPASPHRAGHYSGLHPEDQPFQTSFIPVQRAPALTRVLAQESDEVLLPVVTASTAAPLLAPKPEQFVPERLSKRQVAVPSPLPLPMPQRHTGSLSQLPVQAPQDRFVLPPLPSQPSPHEQITMPTLEAVYLLRKRQFRSRIMPILLLALCISFLMATSILAFLLLARRPAVSTHPVLKADSNAARVHDSLAKKATMTVRPGAGSLPGPPPEAAIVVKPDSLKFSTIQGTNPAAQSFTISNTGNTPLNWAVTQSTQPLSSWLSIDISSGILSPGESAFINVTCNSSSFPTGNYAATLVVRDTDAGTPVTPQDVQVMMTVS
jgi:hypothetical protein